MQLIENLVDWLREKGISLRKASAQAHIVDGEVRGVPGQEKFFEAEDRRPVQFFGVMPPAAASRKWGEWWHN
jgi:hypothetical protein